MQPADDPVDMSSSESAMTSPTSAGPLDGVRVLDLTSVVMGPLATRILGDLGADVIRVEEPEGDIIRHYEPMRNPAMSAFSVNMNRNKRSIVLDLKSDAGRTALFDLVATCDVFVTNMRAAALERLGVTEATIRAARPDIVFCIANGFGSDGPHHHRAAYDDVIQAASGMASMFAWNGGEPALMPSILADKVTGLHMAYAITAALYRRATTGEGDAIEVPMAETVAAFNLMEHLSGQTFEPPFGGFSYPRVTTPNRRPRRTLDGWVVVLPYSLTAWRRFFAHGGRPELADDPRFATSTDRVANADLLYGLMDDIVATRTTADWLAFCDEHSIPASAVVDLEHIADDEHFAAVGLIVDDEHPTEGAYRYVRDPVRFASRPDTLRRHAPNLGEHTAEVLAEIGYDADHIAAADPRGT